MMIVDLPDTSMIFVSVFTIYQYSTVFRFPGIKFKLDIDTSVNKISSYRYNTSISPSSVIKPACERFIGVQGP